MKQILISIFILFVIPVKSQTYQLNKNLIDRDKKDFLGCKKEVLDVEESFTFNLSTGDLAASFNDVKDEKSISPEYLEKLKDSLTKDSLNSKLLFDIGNYYDRIHDKNNSNNYYKAALEQIDVKLFESDSALFYGTRGYLKFKLGMQGYIEDAKKALNLNPNEEASLGLYLTSLLSNNNYEKAKKFTINRLNNNESFPEISILYLIIINSIEHFSKYMSMDPTYKKEISQRHFNKLIDWSSIEIYCNKLNDKQAALKLNKLKFFFNLIVKVTLFDKNESGKILFNFSENEKKQIKKLERWLVSSLKHKTLNPYTAYKCLGLINFFCFEDAEVATNYYQKAIQIFPINKKKGEFNLDEVYTNLLSIYSYLDNKTEYENLLLKKIEDPEVKSISDYINLSKFYFLENQIEKTRFYINEAEKINSHQFDIYRLKAHADFVEETDIILEGYYMNKASRLAKTDYDYYRLYLQYAIYDMFNNKPNEAFNRLSIIKKNSEDCKTCDRLITTYFKIDN
ncbi:hypothetical protein [Algibacter aquimarinus]|uniref:Tetratricopeptide repeat-containing protein n=1 Tax=Algibacter aquimarinus TaxID=1136748 RepID=A0ABP9H7J9_9FLAO